MDDKRRTEPKFRDEELQEAVDRIQIFWERYGSSVMIFITVLFLGIAAYTFVTKNAANKHENSWGDLASAANPAGLQNLAAETGNSTVRILAILRSGDGFLAEGSIPPTDEVTQEALDQKLKDAAAAYSKVLSLTKVPEFTANAQLGLAAVAESQSDWAAAKGYYEQAILAADLAELTAIKEQAEARIELLPQIESKIEFAPETALPTMGTPDATAAPTKTATPADTTASPAPIIEPAPAENQ
ncbi:hypothetical protein JD969_19445 [Planctomycetota bacterium]|nr:hypothetical protein JD969_19445 [Planctomycetota bacterium]